MVCCVIVTDKVEPPVAGFIFIVTNRLLPVLFASLMVRNTFLLPLPAVSLILSQEGIRGEKDTLQLLLEFMVTESTALTLPDNEMVCLSACKVVDGGGGVGVGDDVDLLQEIYKHPTAIKKKTNFIEKQYNKSKALVQ